MIAAFHLDTFAPLLVSRLLDGVAEGTVLAVCAWLLLRLVRRPGSGTRFAVWFSVLLATALLPLWGGLSHTSVTVIPSAAALARPVLALPLSWARYIFVAWLTLAGLALMRVGIGLWQLRAQRRSSTMLSPEDMDPALREMLQRFRSIRPVDLCVSSQAQVPAAIGFFRPRVVIPAWLLKELSPADLRHVVLHELAHLRRWDDWTNLVQKVLRALLFFHPAVWWLDSRLSLEREMACDDCVLAETSNPRAYAECLAWLAERSYVRRGLALAQAAVNRIRQTSRRVARILDTDRSGATQVSKPALAMVTVFSLICLALQAHTPELVGFRNDPPEGSRLPSTTTAAGSSPVSAAPATAAAQVVQVLASEPVHPGAAKEVAQLHPSTRPAVQKLMMATRTDRGTAPIRTKLSLPRRRSSAPRLLSAMAPSFEHATAVEQSLLVVVEDQQYGPSEHMFQVLVLRVTVFNSNASPVVKSRTI
jgi:beta-lactamase regulating signal transducer with metallopeptidase domain